MKQNERVSNPWKLIEHNPGHYIVMEIATLTIEKFTSQVKTLLYFNYKNKWRSHMGVNVVYAWMCPVINKP